MNQNALGSLALPLPPFENPANPHTLSGRFRAKGGLGGLGFGLSSNPKGASPMLQWLDLPAGVASLSHQRSARMASSQPY
jgi:hypothetical protein